MDCLTQVLGVSAERHNKNNQFLDVLTCLLYLAIHPSVYPPIFLSLIHLSLSYPSISLSCLSICLCYRYLSVFLSIRIYPSQSVYLPAYLSFHTCLLLCLSFSLLLYIYIYIYTYIHTYLSVHVISGHEVFQSRTFLLQSERHSMKSHPGAKMIRTVGLQIAHSR